MTMDTEMQRILAVDDNPHTLRIVEHSLSRAGFDVLTATSGEDALSVISRRGLPHLAVVDLNMPGMDGVELSRTIHDFSDLPIIMLTAVHEEETIVSSIEEFAEDYMVKPFSPSELVARVRRVLRRMGNFGYTLEPVTVVDNRLQVDFANRVAIVDGESTNLTPIETKLLYVLMRNAGKVVTTEFLIRRIWPMDEAYEDRLHVHVHRLRRKVEQEPSKPQYVVSERGVGYRFPARQPV
ncbi:MAG: response regulator transcription factor [Anaerolineales bacterium]|nr:response regulator transcription factor [Anaerolineales bacterium]MCB0026673.1 response regulator transcription factor [Anaerolineales bacterium]MCB8959244.1 response regulator transcription factor [Ardenticatenales bacterium]